VGDGYLSIDEARASIQTEEKEKEEEDVLTDAVVEWI